MSRALWRSAAWGNEGPTLAALDMVLASGDDVDIVDAVPDPLYPSEAVFPPPGVRALTQQQGVTAAHWAAARGMPKALTALRDAGANMHLTTNWGWTPLCAAAACLEAADLALQERIAACMAVLLAAGDEMGAPDISRMLSPETVAQVAVRAGSLPALNVLLLRRQFRTVSTDLFLSMPGADPTLRTYPLLHWAAAVVAPAHALPVLTAIAHHMDMGEEPARCIDAIGAAAWIGNAAAIQALVALGRGVNSAATSYRHMTA